jgi:hypothetical protein
MRGGFFYVLLRLDLRGSWNPRRGDDRWGLIMGESEGLDVISWA